MIKNRPVIPRAVGPPSPLGMAPAFVLLGSFSIFLMLYVDARFSFAVSYAVSIIAVSGWFLIGTEFPDRSSLPVAVSLFLSATVGLFVLSRGIETPDVHFELKDVQAVVLSERSWGYARVALVETGSKNMFKRGGRYVLAYSGPAAANPGSVVRFSGKTAGFERAGEPRSFDEFMYWASRGAYAKISDPDIELVGQSYGISFWRARLSERIKNSLPPRTAGYMLASLTGERDPSLTDFHRDAGTSHLLAVSGLHVGVVYAISWFLLRRFRSRLYVTSAIVWFYAMISGASPSSLRAALMLQCVMLGRMIGRSGGMFNSVCFCGALMLIRNPWLFWDVGWRMSILSVMTLASLYSLDIGRGVKNILAPPAVWLATAAQSAWIFGEVPVAGVAVNVLAVPAFAVLLPVASVLSIPALLGLKYGYVASLPAEFLFGAWERVSNNITFLMPWKARFSAALLVFSLVAVMRLFARACGFSRWRAFAAETAGIVLIFFLLYSMR